MNPLQKEHGDWANKQFASSHFKDGKPNPMAPFHHLTDLAKGEVRELRDALAAGDPETIAMELAGCQLLLYSIAHLCYVDLEQAAWSKAEINFGRQRGEPDENGVVEHA